MQRKAILLYVEMFTIAPVSASGLKGVAMSPREGLRFSANLKWLFTELPFLDRFEAAAASGFTAVEIAAPYDFSEGELRHRLQDNGLQAVLINTPGTAPGTPTSNGVACHADKKALFREQIESAVQYASALGTGIIHVMAGILPKDADLDEARATYLENMAWAARVAESADVTLVLEAVNRRDVPGFFLASLEEGLEVIEQVGSKHVRLLFDYYHCQVSQGDVTRRFERLQPWIAHVQVADAPLRSEPGTGEMRYEFIFDHLRRSGYDGWVGCEYRPLDGTVKGLRWRAMLDQPVPG
jgi:hydroxypyruvate isomerase